MAWIRIVHPDNAEGLLKKIYKNAIERAGKVFNVIRIQSLYPRALQRSTQLFTELMHGEGPLSRVQRELIATTVSRANACGY
jgi:alkylhydroperoxidase family enzyme